MCDDEQKAEIEAVAALSDEERADKLKELEDSVENAETTFKAEVEILQKRYEQLSKDKEATVAAAGPELRVLRGLVLFIFINTLSSETPLFCSYHYCCFCFLLSLLLFQQCRQRS